MSKTQIDKLGERLKKGDISEDDLRLLDAYRRSFTKAYEFVVGAIRNELGLEPTGRPAKSTTSISDKLRRESIRLTQIQDIAGCRLIVSDITNQNRVVKSLSHLFESVSIVDRRDKPSHGYRAVHVVVTHLGKMVEIQVRTALQHIWAELSEKLSDLSDPAIKYGGGDKGIQETLAGASLGVTDNETVELAITNLIARLSAEGRLTDEKRQEINELQQELILIRQKFFEGLRDALRLLQNLERKT